MDAIKIEIKGKEWIIRQSFRGYLLYEEMTGLQVGDIKTMKDMVTLLYCTFKGSNKDWTYTYEEFIDIIDEDPEIFTKFNEFNTDSTKPVEKKRKKV